MGDKMKKVFIFIGSNHKNSITEKIVEDIIFGLKIQYTNLNLFKYKYTENMIKCCEGCSSCFNGKKCHLDTLDKMSEIKEKLSEADIIIFATPVYFKNVSSAMKIFLDRITYMTHLYYLFGKQGIIVVTSSLTGLKETSSYLYDFCLGLGLINIKRINFCLALDNQVKFRENIYNMCEQIYYEDKNEILYDEYETIFKKYQNFYKKISNNYEKSYWKKQGLLDSNSYKEYIDKNK